MKSALQVTLALTLVVICTSLPFSSRDIQTFIRRVESNNVQDGIVKRNGECHQVGYKASCCQHIECDEIDLNDTVCVAVTYLPSDYGLSFTVTIDNKVIINETVSARNPPPVCAAVPYLKKYASICIRFYNIDVSSSTFSACAKIQIELIKVEVAAYDLGCFKIPLGESVFNQNVGLNFTPDRRDMALRKTESVKKDDNFGVIEKRVSWSKEISVIST